MVMPELSEDAKYRDTESADGWRRMLDGVKRHGLDGHQALLILTIISHYHLVIGHCHDNVTSPVVGGQSSPHVMTVLLCHAIRC